MRFCVYEISQYSSFVLCSFCLTKPGQSSTFHFPYLSLRVSALLQVFLSTPFRPFFIPSLHQLKQCKPRKSVQIYQYANQFNDHLLSSESFSGRQNRSRSPICFSLTGHLLLLSRSSIYHPDRLFFHAFQVCKMSLVFGGWFLSSKPRLFRLSSLL